MASSPPQRPENLGFAEDHESRTGTLLAVAVALSVLSTFSTALRLYTRTRILGIFHRDDVAIICAQVMSIIFSVLIGIETMYGLGLHLWVVDPADFLMQIQLMYGLVLSYNLALNIVKIGFLLLYLRIFSSTGLRRVSKWVLAYVLVWTAAQLVILAVTCMPLVVLAPRMEGRCLDTYAVWITSSVMSTVTDFVIFALPLPVVLRLNLPPKQKIVTVLMFSIGFFLCIVSIVRVFILKATMKSEDPTWENVGSSACSIAELNCAILCNNLLALRPLIARHFPALSMSSGHPTSSDANARYGPPTVGSWTLRRRSRSVVSCCGNEEPGGNSAGDLKVMARCFSGSWKDAREVELVGSKLGMEILVKTNTTIVSDEATVRSPRHQASFSWEERTLNGEVTSRL